MRKTLIVLGCMSLGLAHAQQDFEKRVGINTENPRASLEVKATNFNGITQGILFPHIDEDEKARWTKSEDKGLVAGTVIWNTTKLCLDYFDGTNWQCTDGTKPNVHPTKWVQGPTSFTGTYTHPITTQDFTRNTCVAPQTGTTVSYTSQAITKTATSTVSQEDANEQARQQALAEFNKLGQAYANQNGQCQSPTFTGTYTHPATTQSFKRNDCVAPQVGTTVSYTSTEISKTYVSNISKEDANEQAKQLALAEYNKLGQEYANQKGNCRTAASVSSVGYSGNFNYRNDLKDDNNYVIFKVINRGDAAMGPLDLSQAVTISGQPQVTIIPGQFMDVVLNPGESRELKYRLQGRLQEGTMQATFRNSNFGASSSTPKTISEPFCNPFC